MSFQRQSDGITWRQSDGFSNDRAVQISRNVFRYLSRGEVNDEQRLSYHLALGGMFIN